MVIELGEEWPVLCPHVKCNWTFSNLEPANQPCYRFNNVNKRKTQIDLASELSEKKREEKFINSLNCFQDAGKGRYKKLSRNGKSIVLSREIVQR